MQRMRTTPADHLIFVCPISVAEIEWGLRISDGGEDEMRAATRRFLEDTILTHVFPIDVTTRNSYAEIMERIWRARPPAKPGTQRHLTDIGVDINDVWISAVALERNLTILSEDGMRVIRECIPELRFQNWLEA